MIDIFKIRKSKPSGKDRYGKFVGAMLPPQADTYLSLYSLHRKISKGAILREVIDKWMEQQQKEMNELQIIDSLIDRVEREWEVYRAVVGKERANWDKFRTELERELSNKGIQPDIIASIMDNASHEEK